MEPLNLNATPDNSEEAQQEIIDDELEKVFKDFNEFQQRILQSSSSSTMKLEDIIDLYINNGGEDSHIASQTTQGQFTTLVEEVNQFDGVLPPQQVEPTHIQSEYSFKNNIDREIQEGETMIKEIAESKVTYIRYGDLNNSEAAHALLGTVFGGGNETVFRSAMRFLRRMYLSPHGGVHDDSRRTRVKSKYRG